MTEIGEKVQFPVILKRTSLTYPLNLKAVAKDNERLGIYRSIYADIYSGLGILMLQAAVSFNLGSQTCLLHKHVSRGCVI
jgi:hypothetical protein